MGWRARRAAPRSRRARSPAALADVAAEWLSDAARTTAFGDALAPLLAPMRELVDAEPCALERAVHAARQELDRQLRDVDGALAAARDTAHAQDAATARELEASRARENDAPALAAGSEDALEAAHADARDERDAASARCATPRTRMPSARWAPPNGASRHRANGEIQARARREPARAAARAARAARRRERRACARAARLARGRPARALAARAPTLALK